ncbi:MAG: DNA/RNA non-specific endonuclease, partial [Paracoccaceae bacterium]
GHVLRRDGRQWHEEDGDDQVDWVANEGVRVSAVVRDLRRRHDSLKNAKHRDILAQLLASTGDPAAEISAVEVVEEEARPRPPTSRSEIGESGQTMATYVFNLSGPVTIHNYGGGHPVAENGPKTRSAEPTTGIEERAIRFDPDYSKENRRGYDVFFLDPEDKRLEVPLPGVHADRQGEMLLGDDGKPWVLDYHHFSLTMNKNRRLQMWSAVNVNYAAEVKFKGDRKSFGSDKWIADKRIPVELQITDPQFYKPATNIDRGHMVRREDNCWGESEREIEYANSDTFHWTNCTPQHEAFNQSDPGRNDGAYRGMKGLWGAFENHVQTELSADNDRACILAGPILAADDPMSRDFGSGSLQYPLRFWKVVVVKTRGKSRSARPILKAFGFVFSQKDVVDRFRLERFQIGRFTEYQKSLAFIEAEAGVTFAKSLHTADQAETRGS